MKKEVTILKNSLGSLEKEILELLWKNGHGRVRDLYNTIKTKREVAHTSIAVLLDRLHKKKLVKRKMETCRGGFRYTYFPVSKKEDFQKAIMQKVVDSLIEKFGSTATVYFNQRFGKKRG